MTMMKRSIPLAFVVLLTTAPLYAVPPDQINYQAVLRDAADVPIDTDVEIFFRFFDAAAAGNEILIDAHVATGTGLITFKGGLLNVAIGSGESIDGSGPGTYVSLAEVFRDYGEVWVELQIDGEVLVPRVKLLSAAFALNADHLDGRDASAFLDTSSTTQTKAGSIIVGGNTKVTGQLTVVGGNPAAGRVLTSNATGLASWQDLPAAQANTLGGLADRLRTGDPADLPFATLRNFDCSGANTATLSFTAGAASLGTVTGFVGSDGISRTYEYLIAIERSDTALDQEATVGMNGRLTLQRAGGTTTFSGLITEFGLAGYANGVATYVARLEPQMVVMGRSSGYQTFLDAKASAVLTQMLSEAGMVADVTATSHIYTLTMRYEESPLDYFNRLAEAEGLHYHFWEDTAGEQLRVRLNNSGFTSIPGTFNYYGDLQDPGTGEEFIATFHAQRRQFTGTVTAGGWDYLTKSVVSHSVTVPGGTGEFQEFFADATSMLQATTHAQSGAQREQVRRMERSGTSNVAYLKAGHVFALSDLAGAGFGGSHIVTETRHYAVNDPANSCVAYGNAFSALPLTTEYKPPRRTHPPNVQGPVHAIVTDNRDPDELGRVKVKFVGDIPEITISGWARIAHPSHQGKRRAIPAIDDEVLVDFIRGDPNAPVVIGSLFNGSGGRDLPPFCGDLFMVDDTGRSGLGLIGCNDATTPNDPCPQHIYFHDDGAADDESLSWNDLDDRFELTNDLALGGSEIFMAKDGPEGNRFIYFYDGISPTDESLSWNDPADRFDLTNDLSVNGAVDAAGAIKGTSLDVGTTGAIMAGSLDVSLPSQFDSVLTVNGPLVAGSTLTVAGPVTIGGGNPAVGKVLTSDAGGLASWQDLPSTQASELRALADRLTTVDPSELPFATLGSFDCSGPNSATLAFSVAGAPLGEVVGYVGNDRISAPFEYLIAIETPSAGPAPESRIGQIGRLTLQRVGGTTTFSGEPRLVRLGRSTGYRVFQQSTPDGILTQILGEEGLTDMIDRRNAINPTLEMEIRYDESKLTFFNRLAERFGIHYHFEENATADLIALGDDNTGFTTITGSFNYHGDMRDPGSGEEFVSTFHARTRRFTGDSTVAGYDFTSPPTSVSGSATVPGGVGESYEFLEAGVANSAEATSLAQQVVEREQVRRLEHSGTSTVADLKAGHVFTLVDQSPAGFGGAYLITGVTHFALRGDTPTCISYGNTFTALPSTATYRSPRRTPLPTVDGPLTAVVVGPFGEEVFTDEHARVKVEFRWDREGMSDENSSAWIRVATPPGKNLRDIFLPRIGTEVLVDFVQGNPSQPIIVGSMYNGVQTPQLPMPANKMVNQLRTDELMLTNQCMDASQSLPRDQFIHFCGSSGGADLTLNHLKWDDNASRFEFSDDLTVVGAVEAGGMFKGASLDVTGGIKASSLDVGSTGPIVAGSLVVTLPSTFDSILTVNGPLVAGSTMTVAGPVSLNGATLSQTAGTFTFAGDLSAGSVDLTGDLTVGGGDITTTGMLNIAPTAQLLLSGSTVNISSNNFVAASTGDVSTMIDSNNNSFVNVAGWYHDGSLANTSKLAELHETGNLRVRGSLIPFVSFDLAESFRASEPVEAGDLVRLDPGSAGSIRLTEGAGDSLVIGVVSEKPGIVLGGGAFDAVSLNSTWGAEVGALYAVDRARLREEVLVERGDLRRKLEPIDSPQPASGDDLLAIEDQIESSSLERFFEERFAPVALAGRVPVKVDASFGAIQPGDALAPSPLPGVAMKATGPGPTVGTALEGLAVGRGKVLALVHRGQFGAGAGAEASASDAAKGSEEVATAQPVSVRSLVDEDTPFTIGVQGSDVLRVDAAGNVYARGAFHPAAMDLAEYFPLSAPASMGDVLVLDRDEPGSYEPGHSAHDPTVVGIVSAEPGVLLGSGIDRIANADAALAEELAAARRVGDERLEDRIWAALKSRFRETHAPVALSGTVPCKVDAGYGAIVPGDLLTTSPTPGHAMRAGEPVAGTIVGKALESLDAGAGTIRVLVMLR